jgi:sigma-54 dependent transcriptional regulator, flagellar regulatory protein
MRLGTLRPNNAAAVASISPLTIPDTGMRVDNEEITGIRRNGMTLRPTSRGKIIGQHPTIKKVLDTIDRVAGSMCTVLVTGESGTGKELVVAALHDASTRRTGPMVTINCGAIPAELVESELFGHVKGAFTGAQAARRGHVASAEGGTLFLDEIGELPMSAQVKLLRVLQQREYTPVGDSRAVKCDVRIVAATNRDLKAEVAAGRFREDLFYRLNVIQLKLPALRERGTDVRVLASHFYRGFVVASGRNDLRGFSNSALAAIEAHPWPGNVRALENAIERSVLLARGPFIEADDVLGTGAGISITMNAVSAPIASIRIDPRREPSRTPPTREVVAQRDVAPPSPPPSPRELVSRDPRRESDATALPPPPKLARFESSPRHEAVARPAVVSMQAESTAKSSNPLFPRVLPEQGFDLFSAVESYQNNLIRQALTRTGGNKNKAAQLLGLNRTTLVEMIRRRGL